MNMKILTSKLYSKHEVMKQSGHTDVKFIDH